MAPIFGGSNTRLVRKGPEPRRRLRMASGAWKRRPFRPPFPSSIPLALLADMLPAILAAEQGAGDADKAVAAGIVFAADRVGGDGSRGADRAADDAGRDIARPEAAVIVPAVVAVAPAGVPVGRPIGLIPIGLTLVAAGSRGFPVPGSGNWRLDRTARNSRDCRRPPAPSRGLRAPTQGSQRRRELLIVSLVTPLQVPQAFCDDRSGAALSREPNADAAARCSGFRGLCDLQTGVKFRLASHLKDRGISCRRATSITAAAKPVCAAISRLMRTCRTAAGRAVFHEGLGLGDFAMERARRLAGLGYVALAADMFGDRRQATNLQEVATLVGGLRAEPGELRARGHAALDIARRVAAGRCRQAGGDRVLLWRIGGARTGARWRRVEGGRQFPWRAGDETAGASRAG